MYLLVLYLMLVQQIITLASNETLVSVHGKLKRTIEFEKTDCDHDFVEFFDIVPPKNSLYTFRVAKLARSFIIDIKMRNLKSQLILYHIKLDGCAFINNPIMNKVLGSIYRKVLLNSTFKCPIPPKIYFMRSIASMYSIPAFHPIGRYHLNARIKMTESPAPFVMEIDWIYRVTNLN